MKLRTWTQELSNEATLDLSIKMAHHHCERSGRFRGQLAGYLADRNYVGLSGFSPDFRYDDDPVALFHAMQVAALFKKYERLPLGIDKERVAWEGFKASEVKCKDTNQFFDAFDDGAQMCIPSDVAAVLHGAQRKIARCLGDVPALAALPFSFGPGACTSVKAKIANSATKLSGSLACSANCATIASAILAEAPQWVSAHAVEDNDSSSVVMLEIHDGRLQFVPKNAKTYRSIVVEPLINSFAQKGIGTYIRGCLRRAGVDLDSQERNQVLACQGSRSGSLATIDLSAASDSIARSLVRHLLPYDWWRLLSDTRTPAVTYAGNRIVLEKFSSMGNAYTFELETLIFWGLVSSVCSHLSLPSGWTAVYGDDIIVPTEAVSLVEKVLAFCGFTINSDKSFVVGPFRESCGKDYFLGSDIRPFFLKKNWSVAVLFTYHNFLMRSFEFELAKVVRGLIPDHLLLFGPDGFGDGHLIGSWESRRSRAQDSTWEGGTFETFALRGNRLDPDHLGAITIHDGFMSAIISYSTYVGQSREGPVDLGTVRGWRGYKRIRIYTLRQGVFLT